MAFKNEEYRKPEFKQVSNVVWEVPTSFKKGMKVPARIYAKKSLLDQMDLEVFDQAANAAMLPGLLKYSYVFSDGHSGYGVPVGWCGAFDLKEGIISPGAIGFDQNCGMRLLKTNLTFDQVKPKIKELTDLLFKMVPAGVGATAYQEPKEIANIPEGKFKEIVEEGVKWAYENGYAWKQDLERIEENGSVDYADFSKVSKEAYKRGKSQIGTLGSGNHYLEIQVIERIYDKEIAKKWGLGENENQVCVMVHCGSRGFGHQICTDYLSIFNNAMKKYGINVLDQQLACAPFESQEGQDFLGAMGCGINYAFVNRQLIIYQIRKAFEKVFNKSAEDLGLEIVYDVAHNTAKVEEHLVDGKKRKVVVHRKGATRSFGPGNEELSKIYKETGQPVIVGGSMETGSFLCVGTRKAEEETFGTTLHGSGRVMSRTKAKNLFRGDQLQRKMMEKGIYVKATTMSGLAEEAGDAYKDINEVVDSMHQAGISLKVIKLKPIANIKG
ncbi:MAG: RtcB family protein [Candidatus Aenigmarchaeota archaeon]|nr:RtcB family protein [Candidatus Aenigmarchaeota archaeon]